jgi:hypothetical protein
VTEGGRERGGAEIRAGHVMGGRGEEVKVGADLAGDDQPSAYRNIFDLEHESSEARGQSVLVNAG